MAVPQIEEDKLSTLAMVGIVAGGVAVFLLVNVAACVVLHATYVLTQSGSGVLQMVPFLLRGRGKGKVHDGAP